MRLPCEDGRWRELLRMEQRIEGTQWVGQVCFELVRAAWQKKQKRGLQMNRGRWTGFRPQTVRGRRRGLKDCSKADCCSASNPDPSESSEINKKAYPLASGSSRY